MKFTRYLQDTQVPEWKKAYIDYRGLKDHIYTVKKQQEYEDRRYQSSFYQGIPSRPHMLRLSSIGRNGKAEVFRYSPRYSGDFSPRMKQLPVDVERSSTFYNPNFLDASTSVSSQSKTLCLPMQELPPKVNEAEMEFLVKLDQELEKVDQFYLAREKEVKDRLGQLKQQLLELRDHQQCSQRSRIDDRRLKSTLGFITSPSRSNSPSINAFADESDGRFRVMESKRAKKRLQKAMVEHYKKLDALQNFRSLNLIGFQKVLKKWEKVTHMAIQDVYIKEKIEPSGFSSTKVLAEVTKDTEEMYAVHFASGNKKKALARLSAGWTQKTHYFATFRSGICLGLAVPALASGLYQTFQQSTRDQIPVWSGLLIVYATIFIPVLFSLLVAINILVWSKVRVNHVFIFGLNSKTKIDHRQYLEIPAILMSTLCYAFCLSFNRIDLHSIKPTTWPLIWFGFNTFMLCNPFPVFHRSSRVWLIKKFARLLVSGLKRVEFTDFWLGDQICSLNFSLTNLYFVACVYQTGFGPDWNQKCGARGYLAPHILLSMSPFFCRFIQSLRRWYDSRNDCRSQTHLINAGKYVTGMLMYIFYYYWRFKGNQKGVTMALYILSAMLYNVYACIWDYLTDWSLLRTHAKYPLLRDELLCADHLPLYYFAIITNFVVRFSWIIYLPSKGPAFDLRSFIVGMLEMLRRWQWNFLRLENEHLGNIDEYRATRDVPLPYPFDSAGKDSDVEDWDPPYMSQKRLVERIFV